nr:MAG TPA: hypothetical protein [Caudoviricetes sp.]
MINQKNKNKNRKDFQIRLHQPQAQACGFFVCNNKSSDRNHCLSAVANS